MVILEGLATGARRLGDELPHGDPGFVARVDALLMEVERAAERPGLARLFASPSSLKSSVRTVSLRG